MNKKRIEVGDLVKVFNTQLGCDVAGKVLATPTQGSEYWIIHSPAGIVYVGFNFYIMRLWEKAARSGGRPGLDRMDLEKRAIAMGVFIPDNISDLRLDSLVTRAEADQILREKLKKGRKT